MAQMKVKIPLLTNLIHMRPDMRDAYNPEGLSSMPIRGCSRCATLRKRYEKALLDVMQARHTHEMRARLGTVEATYAVNDNFNDLVNERDALRHHVIMNHPETDSATLIG